MVLEFLLIKDSLPKSNEGIRVNNNLSDEEDINSVVQQGSMLGSFWSHCF